MKTTTLPISQPVNGTMVPLGDCPVPAEGELVLMSFRGSVAHGLYVDPANPLCIDDVDLLGIMVAPSHCYIGLSNWGSRGTWEYRHDKWDVVVYELRKFVSMLLAGNPNVVSSLWLRPEFYAHCKYAGQQLLENRNLFLSKKIYHAFKGYAGDQIKKMQTRTREELQAYLDFTAEAKRRGIHPNQEWRCTNCTGVYPDRSCPKCRLEFRANGKNEECSPMVPAGPQSEEERDRLARKYDHFSNSDILENLKRFRRKGENIGYMGDKRKQLVLNRGFDSKNAAHCIRLLRMCKEFLREGKFYAYRPDVGDDRELMNIKMGGWTLERIKEHAAILEQDCETLFRISTLPDEPNFDRAERLVSTILRVYV